LVKHARKRGPLSLLEASKAPKGMGFKARLCHRYVTEVQSAASREAVRKGFAAMWRHAPKLMRQFKIPRPGQFIKSNIHGGKLWGGYTEWHKNSVTAIRMGRLFEACALNQACSDSVLCQISKTMSYLYLLETGEAKKNWRTLPGLKVTLAKRKRIKLSNPPTFRPRTCWRTPSLRSGDLVMMTCPY